MVWSPAGAALITAAARGPFGIARRCRRVTVPGWLRALPLARGFAFQPFDAGGGREAPEMDARFERERGAEASAPVGAGGQAAREQAVNRTRG